MSGMWFGAVERVQRPFRWLQPYDEHKWLTLSDLRVEFRLQKTPKRLHFVAAEFS